MATLTLRSEEVASQHLQDTRSAREARGSSPISDESSHTSTQCPLEKGAPKDLSEANPGTPTLPTSQRQRMLRWHMLHIPHIFTRHCKAFIWVWVSGACEGGRFVGTQGKPAVLSMCHRILCTLRIPETGVQERGFGIEASSGGAS